MKKLAILLLSTEKKEDLNVLMISEAICGRLCYCWANIHYPLPSCMEEIFFPIPLIVSLDSLVPAICLDMNMPSATSVLSDWIPSEKTGRTELNHPKA